MSWGEGASGAAEAGSNASNAGSVGVMASDATPSYSFNMGDVGGTGADAGYSLETAGNTPSAPWYDQVYDYYDRFTKGMEQKAPDAYKNFGNNPETYGYAYGKLNQFAGMGKGGQSPQAPSINVNYQQPDNPYLRKRGY